MNEHDFMTDDVKLVSVLLRDQLAHHAWWVAEQAGVDEDYAEEALARMADWTQDQGDPGYPILRRFDLGPDVYEAIEDSAREWKREGGV